MGGCDHEISHAGLLRSVAEDRDLGCFARLFDYYAPRIAGWIAATQGGLSIAEDIAQETMLSVWHMAHQYDASRGSVATWIFTIARNRWIDHLRRENHPSVRLEGFQRGPTSAPTPEDSVEIDERDLRLKRAVEALPQEQASVIRGVFCEGLPHTEVGEHLGIPLGTVKSRLRLALDKLRTILLMWGC